MQKLHLWIGLTSGLLVFLISISGSLYAFRDELYTFFQKDKLFLEATSIGEKPLPLATIWQAAETHLGQGVTCPWSFTYPEKDRAWQFIAYKVDTVGLTYFSRVCYHKVVCVNPYTAQVVGVIDEKYEFFNLVKMFHWSFFLNNDIGQQIVGWSVVVFVLSLFSGVYLWWKRKGSWKKKFTFKKQAKWKRKNYDYHNVLGVYTFAFALVMACTGLVMAFRWFMSLVYVVFALSLTPPAPHPESDPIDDRTVLLQKAGAIADQFITTVQGTYYRIIMSTPYEGNPTHPIEAYVQHSEKNYDGKAYYYDNVSGEPIAALGFDGLNLGQKVLYMNYDIHVGSVFGFWGKVLAFFVGLICASLPLTGFLIWWGRRNK